MDKNLSFEKFELIPGRVEAAMQFIRHCETITEPDSCCGHRPGRVLTAQEQAAYLAALEAVRLYFTTEMDFGGPPTRIPETDPAQAEPSPKRLKKKDKDKDKDRD